MGKAFCFELKTRASEETVNRCDICAENLYQK